MFGEVQPGAAVALHRHSYEELFIIQQGRASFTIGETVVEAQAGDIVVIPAGVPHRFRNTGAEPLVQTAVHAAGAIAIEWLE
jgi:mannose-6-phosphate isomerase-like protein (cupin superfamily)